MNHLLYTRKVQMYNYVSTGNATRKCYDGEWQKAQVLDCDNSRFINALVEVIKQLINISPRLLLRLYC